MCVIFSVFIISFSLGEGGHWQLLVLICRFAVGRRVIGYTTLSNPSGGRGRESSSFFSCLSPLMVSFFNFVAVGCWGVGERISGAAFSFFYVFFFQALRGALVLVELRACFADRVAELFFRFIVYEWFSFSFFSSSLR